MKKFLILFLVLCLVVGLAAADDGEDAEKDDIGLSVTLEGGAYNLTSANDWDITPYLYVALGYDKSFFNDRFSFGASLGYEVNFVDEYPMFLYIDLSLGYCLGIGRSSLSFLLADENTVDFSVEEDKFSGIFWPGIKYNYGSEKAGDFYFQADVPISYIDVLVGLDLTLGWESVFGLGLKAAGHLLFNSEFEDNNGFTGLDFYVSYALPPIPLFIGVGVMVPLKNMKSGDIPYSFFDTIPNSGVKIAPYISYTIKSFDIYGYCSFDHIGVDDSGIGIVFGLGVTYSF